MLVVRERGEQYYLGIQTDISAEFHPPYLGHQVLVEGTVSSEPRICGGIVLKPVRVSPLPEPDSSCNTILPAVDQFTVPFAPRPPGPSGGRLAFQGTAQPAPARSSTPSGPREFTLQYDFDNGVMGRHAGVLGQILNQTRASKATRVSITGYRGATRLSDGRVMTERPDIGARRAREVADLLQEAGLTGRRRRGFVPGRARSRRRHRRLEVAAHDRARGTLRRTAERREDAFGFSCR